ncbi:MAG: glycosyltransferase family 39 protein [Vicinamibacterales bacterium]
MLRVAAVFLTALAVRLLHLWQMSGTPYFATLLGDARGYDQWARRLAGGDWIGTDVFYQAPLYPYVLGVIYTLTGAEPGAARVVQAVLGSASAALLLVAATRLFGARAGLIAGMMLALYAPAIFLPGRSRSPWCRTSMPRSSWRGTPGPRSAAPRGRSAAS